MKHQKRHKTPLRAFGMGTIALVGFFAAISAVLHSSATTPFRFAADTIPPSSAHTAGCWYDNGGPWVSINLYDNTGRFLQDQTIDAGQNVRIDYVWRGETEMAPTMSPPANEQVINPLGPDQVGKLVPSRQGHSKISPTQTTTYILTPPGKPGCAVSFTITVRAAGGSSSITSSLSAPVPSTTLIPTDMSIRQSTPDMVRRKGWPIVSGEDDVAAYCPPQKAPPSSTPSGGGGAMGGGMRDYGLGGMYVVGMKHQDSSAITCTCSDTDDGKQYEVGGFAQNGGKIVEDHCKSPDILFEAYCANDGKIMGRQVNCPYGCVQGACRSPDDTHCENRRDEVGCTAAPWRGATCVWDIAISLCAVKQETSSSSSSVAEQSPVISASSAASVHTVPLQIAWKKYRVDEYTFDLPGAWKARKAKRRKVGDVWGKEIDFFNKGKVHTATLRCPIIITGYEGWDIEEQKRTYKAGKRLHGATLWIGKAKEELKDFAILFMHRNTFDHWMDAARDARHSCQLTAGEVDLSRDRETWRRIYESVR